MSFIKATARYKYLGVFAEDFGVETNPVVRDEHFALI